MQIVNPVTRRRGSYVVTYDVASRLQLFRESNLIVPAQDDPMFERFHLHLFEKIEQALPGIAIDTIEMSEIRRKIWEQVVHHIHDAPNSAVLSTCPEIASSNMQGESLILNINRLCNTDGEIIGHGPRPGYDSLAKQLDELTIKIAGRPIILIEDGAFSGNTLRFVLSELGNRGLEVPTIIIGFFCRRAKAVLQEVFSGELVIVHPIEDLIDWIPDHDLIPFVPNCGRVLGEQASHSFMPIKTADGVSCAYPYILPFGNIEAWASLPAGKTRELSRYCLEVAIEIWYLNKQVTIRDLVLACPRVSLPISIGLPTDIPSLDTDVVGFLRHMHKRLG